jgi:hypothetical protein
VENSQVAKQNASFYKCSIGAHDVSFFISVNSGCYLQDIQSMQLKSYSRTEHTRNTNNLRKERQDSLIEERHK